MNDDDLLLLLMQTIRVNGNTMYLLEHGYTLVALNRDIDSLKREGYVANKGQELFITKKGEDYFYRKNKELGRKGLYSYLSGELSMKEEPMPLNAIYVPLKRGKGKKK